MSKRIFILTVFLTLFFTQKPLAQQTVGLFLNDSLAFNGYTLFSSLGSDTTYLIDNCGKEVHRWNSLYRPAMSVYLLEDGRLLRTCKLPSTLYPVAGRGGRIEMLDWNSNVLWSAELHDNLWHPHHDIEYLPNGNILVLAWEYKDSLQSIAMGRDIAKLDQYLLPEMILEIEPLGTDSFSIVWEWHTWDHLVQDFDSTKANYGVISEHPELIDLNYFFVGSNPAQPDLMHGNSLDYHPVFDQVMISILKYNEIWIIDHSTSSQEAAGHSGGNYGKGGDILYRWGNPQAYGRGNASNHVFYGQHDAHWIEPGLAGEGRIMVYNNGESRPGGSYSSSDVFSPPVDASGNYSIAAGQPYGPASLDWTFVANPPASFFSSKISGSSRLPNGNTLICEGSNGRIFEVDSLGNKHWEYVNPTGGAGTASQGQPTNQNSTFRATRYAPDYPGLDGQTLVPGQPVELNPWPYSCTIWWDSSDVSIHQQVNSAFRVWPNPADDVLYLDIPSTKGQSPQYLDLMDITGRVLIRQRIDANGLQSIDVRELRPGIYFLRVEGFEGQKVVIY